MSEQSTGSHRNSAPKWAAGLLSAVIVLVASLLFNFYQAGAVRQLSTLDSAMKDIGSINVKIGVIETKVDALKESLDKHLAQR